MPFIADLFRFIVVAIVVVAIPLLLLAVLASIVGGFVYLVAGPEFRMQMLNWAPGVPEGARAALGLAQENPDDSRESE